jgi:hypothetical protein
MRVALAFACSVVPGSCGAGTIFFGAGFHQIMGRRRVIGWKLNRAEREALLARIPPAYPDVVADHVTLAVDDRGSQPLPGPETGTIVGIGDDGDGVQALVVEINGTTDRPDGSTYHVTWSLDKGRGRRAKDSNDVLRRKGWRSLDATAIELTPGIVG